MDGSLRSSLPTNENKENNENKDKAKSSENFSFDDVNFEKIFESMSSLSPQDHDKMLEFILINFPIEKYAETINNIFKIFENSKSSTDFVDALKNRKKR